MSLHTIHVPNINSRLSGLKQDVLTWQIENIVSIKEGFCWPAFFFSIFWSVWHQLWLVSAGLLSLQISTHLVIFHLGLTENTYFIVGLGIALITGYLANDWRRAALIWRGYSEKMCIPAFSATSATKTYVNIWLKRC